MVFLEAFTHCRVRFVMKKHIVKLICFFVIFCTLYGCNSKSKSFLQINSFFNDAVLSTNIKCEGWFAPQSVLFEAKNMSQSFIINEIKENTENIYNVFAISEKVILINQIISDNKSRYYMICKTNIKDCFYAFDMCLELDGIYKNESAFCKVIFPYQFSDLLTQKILMDKEPLSLSWDWNDDIILNDKITIADIQNFYSSLGMYKIEETQSGFVLQENEFLPIALNFHIKITEDDRNVIVIYPIK